MTNADAYQVTADELRKFVERIEAQTERVKDEQEARKEIYAELKARGYSVPVVKDLIKRRAQKPDDVAEREALLDTYKSALGMS